jgi:pimeloyl-ACP methyl ester carboxylesterase
MDHLGLDQAAIAGHSMGGKVAMYLALTQAERVSDLVVADIAPVAYSHRFERQFSAMSGLDLEKLTDRADADRQMAEILPEPELRNYLLQNLNNRPDGWRWRIDLQLLRQAIEQLTGFPDLGDHNFPGEALFLYGEKSDYVRHSDYARIRSLFPYARIRRISQAGHWVYAEQPEIFVQAIRNFLPLSV